LTPLCCQSITYTITAVGDEAQSVPLCSALSTEGVILLE
jgi:hypothetical protein